MSLKTDKIQLEIVIKGDKVRAELMKLEADSKKLSRELKKLPEGTDEFIKKSAELKTVQSRMDQLKNQIGLTGMTMRELRNRSKELMLAMNHIDPRTTQFKEYRAELDKVNARMKELRTGTTQAGFSFNKMADGFNKYMGVFAAISAGILGVVLSMRKMVDAFSEYEQKVANLSAITGLAGDDLAWLSEKAKEMSVSTTESGVRITKSADDIVDAFTKMGSKRPELLKNKEALAQVTEQALILAEAGQMELEVAIEAVAASMNQFNLDASESERIINTLAAGSLEGSAEIDSLSASLKNVGTVADNSNMTLEETVAALEVLASKQLMGEEAGTKFRGALLKMKEAGVGYASGAFNMRDALIETNNIMNSLGSEMEKDAALQKIFGTENVTVGTILLNNIPAYDKLTAAVTGTDQAIKQANINTSTQKAELEQAKNRAHNMAIELGEKLAPIMTFSTNVGAKFLKFLVQLPQILRDNKVLIMALGVALLAYNAQKIKGIALKIRDFALMKTGIALRAKEYVQYQMMLYQEKLAIIQKANLAKGTGGLRGAFQKLFALIKMNPFGALIVAAGALLIAFTQLGSVFSSVSASQKKFNEANQKAAEYAAQEKAELGMLVVELRNSATGSEERKAAIDKLNKTYGQYLPNLLSENASYKDIVRALVEINKQIELKAKLQAYEETLTAAYKDQYEIQKKIKDFEDSNSFSKLTSTVTGASMSYYNEQDENKQVISDLTNEIVKLRTESAASQQQTQSSTAAIDDYTASMDDASQSSASLSEQTKNIKTAYELLNEEISKYEKLLQDQVVSGDARASVTARKLADLKQEKELYDELIKNMQDAAYIQKTIDELGDPAKMRIRATIALGDTSPQESDKAPLLTEWEDYYTESQKLFMDYENAKADFYRNLQGQLVDIAKSAADTIFAYQTKRSNERYQSDLAQIEDRYARGRISEEQYNTAITALNEKKAAEEAKIAMRKGVFEKTMTAGQIAITAIKDIAAIKMQAAVLAANPLTLGYVPASLAQIPIVIGTAALETGLALAKPIAQYAKGKYNVTGSSGRKYNTTFAGIPKTGFYSTPTLGIFGEDGRELVVDFPTVRELERKSPEVIDIIHQTAGRVRQYADGKYPESTATSTAGVNDNSALIVQQNQAIIQILSGIKANSDNTYSFKDLLKRLDEETDRKNFISNNMTGG